MSISRMQLCSRVYARDDCALRFNSERVIMINIGTHPRGKSMGRKRNVRKKGLGKV